MRKRIILAVAIGFGVAASGVQAAMPVVDVGAIAQLIQQLMMLRDQLETARAQLTQAQREFQSMTGPRGMQQLLSGTVRNYLPPDWAALEAAVRQGGGGYGALTAEIETLIDANAILTPQQIARLSSAERAELEAARRSAAMLQATTGQALEAASNRFDSIQQLVDAIGSAQDQKAVLDLQARIAAEQVMLQNEQTKLVLLFHAAQAEQWARQQRAREHAIASIGSLRRLPPIGLND